MIKYFNIKTNYGIETVDEVNSIDFPSYKDFKNEIRNLIEGYSKTSMDVYISQKPDKTWNL